MKQQIVCEHVHLCMYVYCMYIYEITLTCYFLILLLKFIKIIAILYIEQCWNSILICMYVCYIDGLWCVCVWCACVCGVHV